MTGKGLQPLNLFLAIFPSVFCAGIVSLRVFLRLKGGKLGAEDVLLIIATILNAVLSFTTCGYILSSYYGYHFHDIPEGAIDPVVMMKWNYANSIIYNPILALIKVSFLITLIKLRSQNKWINACLWGTLILNGCFAIAAPLACILQCNPISRYWDSSVQGKCVDAGAYTVSTSSIVLTTDVLILLMPSWILHDLKMPLGRKLMVIAFLSSGILVTVVGAVRTSVLIRIFVLKEPLQDPTYQTSYILSNIESGLAIIAVCGPTLKYIMSCCIPSLRNEEKSTNRRYMYPTNDTQRDARSRRSARMAKSRSTFREIDEMQLTQWPENEMAGVRTAQHGEPIMITKTVAWKVENRPEKDSSSTSGEHMPRDIL